MDDTNPDTNCEVICCFVFATYSDSNKIIYLILVHLIHLLITLNQPSQSEVLMQSTSMKWLRCSAVSAVQYCHCVVHCVANEPSRSFTTTTAFSLLKASTSASKSRGRSICLSLGTVTTSWPFVSSSGPLCSNASVCWVTSLCQTGGWWRGTRLISS